MNNFTVDILTPSKVLAKDLPAESLLIPTVKGQINVLKDHTHIVTKLETGLLCVFGGADDADRFFNITVGICKVLDGKIQILSNVVEECNSIDIERAKLALTNATKKLNESDSLSDDELVKFRRKAERARLRIQLAEKYSKK